MKTITSANAKTRFGQFVDMSQREPIAVEKYGRPISVMMSYEDYQHFVELEDKLWALEAKIAEKEGYLSTDETSDFLKSL